MPRRSSTKAENKGAMKDSESPEEELSWAVGLARWSSYETKHGTGLVPDKDPDQQLVRWTKKQRIDYWNWKKGRPAFLGEESFQMLTRFGFEWGQDQGAAVPDDEQPSSKTAAKPAAEQTEKQNGKGNSQDEDNEVEPDEDPSSMTVETAAGEHTKKHLDKGKRFVSNETETPPVPENNASEETVIPSDNGKKKAAKRSKRGEDTNLVEPTTTASSEVKRSRRSKATTPVEPTSGDETDTDHEEENASKGTRSLRRSTRQVTLPPPASPPAESRKRNVPDAAASSSSALKRRKLPTREATRKQAPKTAKRVAKTYETRTLKRLVAPEDEDEDIERQIREEFEHLLVTDEPLEPDKDNGVSIQTATFNRNWEERFFELLVFVKAYGHTLVPKVYNENKTLGRFVAKMRNWYKTNEPHLTPIRQKRLEAINFSWDAKTDPNFWRVQNDTPQASDLWEVRFKELLAYKKLKGDCMVPKNYPPNQVLARWVSKQRRHFRAKQEGNYNTLDDDKVFKLVEVEFVFETKTHTMIRETVLKRFEGRWDYFFNLLLDFKKTHGHCAVPRRWKADQPLASWVMRQRFQWKKMNEGSHSYLTEDRLQRLKDIEFVFHVDRKHSYPIADIIKSPPAAAKSTRRRAKASTPASVLTVEADEDAALSDNDDSDEESDKKPAATSSDGEEDEPATSAPDEEEEEQEELLFSSGGDGDSEVVEEEQAPDEDGNLGASGREDNSGEIAEEKQAPGEKGSIGAPTRGDVDSEAMEENQSPDQEGQTDRGDGNGGTKEEKKATDGADALLLFATERRHSDSETNGDGDTSDEAEALLLLGAKRGDGGKTSGDEDKVRSTGDGVTPGESASAVDSKESKTLVTESNTANGTMYGGKGEDIPTDETPQEVAVKVAAKILKKGVWTCPVCEKDEFEHFIDAAAHEATCSDLAKVAMAMDAHLD